MKSNPRAQGTNPRATGTNPRKKEHVPKPYEAAATAICVQLWETCGEGPKPVLNGNGNPFIAARKIAEKFLEAGYEPDRIGEAMWDCHNRAVITTAALAFALTAHRRRSPDPVPLPLDTNVVELYPGAHLHAKPEELPGAVKQTPEEVERNQARIRELQEQFRADRAE